MEIFTSLPPLFHVACLVIAGCAIYAWKNRYQAWGAPLLVVLATIAVWYPGDALLNDYHAYQMELGAGMLDLAWLQVVLCTISITALTPLMDDLMNRSLPSGGTPLFRYMNGGILNAEAFQQSLDRISRNLLCAWLLLMAIALYRVDGDVIGLFFPFLGHMAEPWSRNRIGGSGDAFISLAINFHIFFSATLGVIAAIARSSSTRNTALVAFVLSASYFIFGRTRNTMLATVLPGLMSWVFFRLRSSLQVKIAVLAIAFFACFFWFSFVMGNRDKTSISYAFQKQWAEDSQGINASGTAHAGLNMFEELVWINTFIETDAFEPNLGERYFAELVNPIPRSLWPNKPLIGIDYAIARGQAGGTDGSAGVFATVSTGLIGQGVVNFGRFFGPIAASVLMAGWVGLIARQGRLSDRPGRFMLYMCGLILTFNLGRDISLLTLYPFFFGWMMIWYADRQSQEINFRNLASREQ